MTLFCVQIEASLRRLPHRKTVTRRDSGPGDVTKLAKNRRPSQMRHCRRVTCNCCCGTSFPISFSLIIGPLRAFTTFREYRPSKTYAPHCLLGALLPIWVRWWEFEMTCESTVLDKYMIIRGGDQCYEFLTLCIVHNLLFTANAPLLIPQVLFRQS